MAAVVISPSQPQTAAAEQDAHLKESAMHQIGNEATGFMPRGEYPWCAVTKTTGDPFC
jgi:hypothetical protein